MKTIKSNRELEVYQLAFQTSMKIYALTKFFPREELYSLTDQIRRSSRSVSAIFQKHFAEENIPNHFAIN